MSKWKTNFAIMAMLAVAATTLSASPTLAQAGRERPTVSVPPSTPTVPKPEVFVPAPPTLTADDAALLTSPPTPGAPSGLRQAGRAAVAPSQRTTAMSRQSVDAKGKGTAELFLNPAFRRNNGQWVEVDSTLRRSSKADQPVVAEGALRPVRFGTSAQRIVELGLDQGPVTLSSRG